jgi:DNA polymerase III epsilon subunit-like protein
MRVEPQARQDAAVPYRELELRMIRDTTKGLFQLMEPQFKGFPDNYLVFDLETTGLNPKRSLIVQFGYCLVQDRKPIDQGGMILNWTLLPKLVPDPEKFKQHLQQIKNNMEFNNGVPTGKKYHITYEKLLNEGLHPIHVLEFIYDLFQSVRHQQWFFVAHNGYHFDVPFVEGHFDCFLGDNREFGGPQLPPFYFGDNELFDTGMVEKGSQAQSAPWGSDTVRSWSRRTQTDRLKNIRWSLDGACVPRHGLDKKYALDMDTAHDAGFDCYVCHLLFEEYKKLLLPGAIEPASIAPSQRGD